jgi:hypothetical protein
MGDILVYSMMKDVSSCDKLRLAATGFDPEISELGNLHRVMSMYPYLNT